MTVISTCPRCESKLDGYRVAAGRPREPKPGDTAVCFHCGTSLVFNADLTLRGLTVLEFVQLTWEEQRNLSEATVRVMLAGMGDAGGRLQ